MGITTSDFINFFWVIVLILINGFFVAAEFAIVRSRRTRIEQFVQQGSRLAKQALLILDSIDSYLSTTQTGITLASLGLGWMAQRSIEPFVLVIFSSFQPIAPVYVTVVSSVVAFAIITFLQIVFGELAPKSVAIARAEEWLMGSAVILKTFRAVMYPAIWLLNITASGVLQVFRVRRFAGRELAHSEEELRMLVTQSHESGVIDAMERELFDNVFAFADRVAREIMVPRTDMVCLFTEQTFDECLSVVQNDRHTRFPLCEGDKDHVVGMIHSKDLYSYVIKEGRSAKGAISKLARKVVSVPEALGIDDVLKVLQRERAGLAIVIDEYGGTAGMVSVEDVLEELVGEIQDEFDEERPPVEEREGYVSIDARLLIEEVNELFGFDLSDEEVDTVGGWVYSQVTQELKPGIEVEFEGTRFVVSETDNLRITRIHVYPPEPKDDQEMAE